MTIRKGLISHRGQYYARVNGIDSMQFLCSYEAHHVADPVEQHESVQEANAVVQQPTFCTLEDCFQLYTREERVCGVLIVY